MWMREGNDSLENKHPVGATRIKDQIGQKTYTFNCHQIIQTMCFFLVETTSHSVSSVEQQQCVASPREFVSLSDITMEAVVWSHESALLANLTLVSL